MNELIARVLVVEDDAATADLTVESLARARHIRLEVQHVTTLRAAQEWLAENHCDLVLLDLNLPDSTGLATLREFKGSGGPPTVVVSGVVDEDLADAAFALGAEDVVPKDELGSRLFASGMVRFIERRQAQQRRRQLEQVLEHGPDAVLVVDRAGAVKYVNNQATAMFGRSRHELAEERLTFAAPAGVPVELRVSHPAGERIGEMRVVDLEWEGERSFLTSIRDVTDKRALEMQLLMRDRLVSLGTLAAGVAHEINNPLSALSANLELALEETDRINGTVACPELIAGLLDAQVAAQRIAQIVRDMKLFSRPEAETQTVCDVHKIVQSVCRMARLETRQRARLELELNPVRPVVANEARLSQVLLNLIVNASQAIPDGAPDANEVRVTTGMTGDGRVVLDVKDTGAGISPEVAARLFSPFFTTKPVGTGTGLGLAISQQIVRGLGGDITFESELGKGSCFRVTLPAASELSLVPPPTNPAQPTKGVRRAQVLVVDDEQMILNALGRALRADHNVCCLDQAGAALARIQEGERFDVVICDLMMPNLNGMEFFSAVEALDSAQAARFVFITGGAFSPQAKAFLDSTQNRCFEKPVDLNQLRRVIESHGPFEETKAG